MKALNRYFFLASIAGIHDQFNNAAEPYSAMLIMNGKRSMIPEDIIGEQTSELAKFAKKISNNSLRARVSDICWLNDRSNYELALVAIEAYCEQVKLYLNGDAHFQHDLDTLIDHRAFELVRRALTIAKSVKGKSDYPKSITDLTHEIKKRGFKNSDISSITRILRLFLDFSIEDNTETAEEAFKIFEAQNNNGDHRNKNFLLVIERLFRRNKMSDKSNECLLMIAECSVEQSNQMSGSSMASAHWLMIAIEELKLARGPKARDRYRELRVLLREKQEESVFELQRIKHSVDISDLVEQNIERQKQLTLGEALGEFASLRVSTTLKDLRDEAIEGIKKHPLSSTFASSQLDGEGKVTSRSESSVVDSAGNEDLILTEIGKNFSYMRNIVVNSGIEPIRQHIQTEFSLRENALAVICENSPFIPPHHEALFLLGFQKFFKGDMISAGSILIPQLENSLRHILKTAGTDTSTIESDSTQVDRSISQLMGIFRDNLIGILGEDIVFEIDFLFNSRKGPALRHEIAHGKFPSGHYYSDDVVYGCWFIYRMTCLPLFQYWDEISMRINTHSSPI